MDKNDIRYTSYLRILHEELVPALGCTEPIALAYAGAKAARVLGREPERIEVQCSGNIIKNVKGVKVPGAGDLKGVKTATVLGAIGGDSDRMLQVLEGVSQRDIDRTGRLIKGDYCTVRLLDGVSALHIIVTVYAGTDSALVELRRGHTNIVRMEHNGETVFCADKEEEAREEAGRGLLSFDGIIEFADSVDIEDVRQLIDMQIQYNTRISEEGLSHNYGANVGKTLLRMYGDDVKVRAKAKAAAGSDARMGGSALPVVINSGSGNQGMTVSLPVIEYAREYRKSQEELYRALVLSNLMAIHQKETVGKLSAYCGVVCAACASGVAIAYLMGESRQVMQDTVVNTLGDVAGIVCDGAKPSCAAKIASSVDAAIMGYSMAVMQNKFQPGDGLIKEDVEDTINTFGRLARQGMQETDKTILHIMTGD